MNIDSWSIIEKVIAAIVSALSAGVVYILKQITQIKESQTEVQTMLFGTSRGGASISLIAKLEHMEKSIEKLITRMEELEKAIKEK